MSWLAGLWRFLRNDSVDTPKRRVSANAARPPVVRERPLLHSDQDTHSTKRGAQGSRVSDAYFAQMEEMAKRKSAGDYAGTKQIALKSVALLPRFVAEWKREFGEFDIKNIPAIEIGAALMAITGDRAGLQQLAVAASAVPELAPWQDVIADAKTDLDLATRIVEAIAAQPGLKQQELKTVLALPDGRRTGVLAGQLEQVGRLVRRRAGASWLLYPAGAAPPSGDADSVSGRGHEWQKLPVAEIAPELQWPHTRAHRARQLSLEGLPVVRLPLPLIERDPTNAQDTHEAGRSTSLFRVEGAGWSIVAEEKLLPDERPDPAFRDVFLGPTYTYWLASRQKKAQSELTKAALRVVDRSGLRVFAQGLRHDVYRADASPSGSGFLAMARDGGLHGYDSQLRAFLFASVSALPEFRAQAQRLGITADELHTHVRCVALSEDHSRFLVTIVDEAWCLRSDGAVEWGLRMPLKDGWAPAERTAIATGTRSDVVEALRTLELAMPVSQEEITQQYRRQAARWHPDRNPRDPQATVRMQKINGAIALLTGVDVSEFSVQAPTQVMYCRPEDVQKVDIPGLGSLSVSLQVSEKFAVDWIYAANLGVDRRAYLGGYSGKVVVVRSDGSPERVIDTGEVPSFIGEVGERLFLLTSGRLFVLTGGRLDAIVDVHRGARALLAEQGFGLQYDKRFEWYTLEGDLAGAVQTRDPIRRTSSAGESLVLETRQHRCRVSGAPTWW